MFPSGLARSQMFVLLSSSSCPLMASLRDALRLGRFPADLAVLRLAVSWAITSYWRRLDVAGWASCFGHASSV